MKEDIELEATRLSIVWAMALLIASAGSTAGPAAAREPVQDQTPARDQTLELEPSMDGKRLRFRIEGKAHVRDGDDVVLGTAFPVPGRPGERVTLRSVDPGDHFELSVVTLFLDADLGERTRVHLKIDLIDRYDRNPTSTDDEWDVDEAWLRFGREAEPGELPERAGVYLKAGKFPKFERQDDRHLESYGLVATAFNRMEDLGLELGFDLGRHVYLKIQATRGNPVFFRDPLALAGDNGTPEVFDPGRDPALGTGLAIVYDLDVDVDDLDFGEPELGAGLGFRFGDASGLRAADFLLWGYRRELARSVPVDGSVYGGDLDFLRGPFDRFPFPISTDEKREYGANLWLYLGGFSFFGQYVDQDLAGLERTGFEAELAWRVQLPLVFSAGGEQLFSAIQPAVRFSRLDPDFPIPAPTPSPSFGWEWQKTDVGLRVDVWRGLDLTLEYAQNEFVVRGREVENNEFLTTLRWLF